MNSLEKQHLDLIRSIAVPYARYGIPLDDLIQEGWLGLYEASKRFDPEKGESLEAYASFWIRKRVLGCLDREMKFKTSELNEDLLEAPEPDEHQGDCTLPESMLPANMPALEKQILRLNYEECLPLDEIGRRLDKTREQVRQLKQKALRRIRAAIRASEEGNLAHFHW